MPRKSRSKNPDRSIALCYVRLSWTKDLSDADSPERQRANIQQVCQLHGWTPEWYQDTDGHKSGTREKNRPGWLALKARLSDPDVVALVANDLSRLHRKGWRVGDLLDFVDDHDVKLVLAAPGKQMDFSTPQGRIFAQLSAIFDEWYAIDVSQRYKDMISHRKRSGKTVGLPPFGTIRGRSTDGYLRPSPFGAWLMPDGTFIAGDQNDPPPHPDALWRGYYASAHRALTLFADGDKGLDKVAYQLQLEGWPFRNRHGQPTPMENDDVRRIVANWAEYGGVVSRLRARERHPHEHPVDAITLIPERAVFDVALLYRVGRVRAERTIKRTANDGEKVKDYPYPLNGITYCHHCDLLAEKHQQPSLRSRLGGKGRTQKGRYRHKHGVNCGCTNKSVKREIFEADFGRLLDLLTVNPDEIDKLVHLGVETLASSDQTDAIQLEAQKLQAINKCRRRIEAARHLYEDGDLTREEYLKRREANEREIAHWESRTTDSQRVALELALCVDAVARMSQLWSHGTDEDRQGLVRNLFSEVVFDLDTQRIVSFRLKPWADQFIILLAALYDEENENPSSDAQGVGKGVTPTGIRAVKLSFVFRFANPSSASSMWRSIATPNLRISPRWNAISASANAA